MWRIWRKASKSLARRAKRDAVLCSRRIGLIAFNARCWLSGPFSATHCMLSACLRSSEGLCNLANVTVADNCTNKDHGIEGASAHTTTGNFHRGHVPPAACQVQPLSDVRWRKSQGNELRIEVKSDTVLLLKASHAPRAFVSATADVLRIKALQQLMYSSVIRPSSPIAKSWPALKAYLRGFCRPGSSEQG